MVTCLLMEGRDTSLILGLGRSSGEGSGTALQHSCLINSTERGVWWATVHGVTESDATEQLHHHHHPVKQALCPENLNHLLEPWLPIWTRHTGTSLAQNTSGKTDHQGRVLTQISFNHCIAREGFRDIKKRMLPTIPCTIFHSKKVKLNYIL